MTSKIINCQKLYKLVVDKKPLNTVFMEIDHTKPFIHSHLTQLYHTPMYDVLNANQKLRYNQLFALRTIEQLMTLEFSFIGKVLQRSSTRKAIRSNRELMFCMNEMAVEETVHYQMFRSINKIAEPTIYDHDEMFFARHTFFENVLLKTLTISPGILQLLVWIVLILEEFSTYISKEMLNKSSPDKLESNFVAAHREHLKDEARHVHICANLLDTICSESSAITSHINAYLLNRFMCEYLTPKHGGIRVINRLIVEYPELSIYKKKFVRAIYDSRYYQPIWHALEEPLAMPVSQMMFDKFPVFKLNAVNKKLANKNAKA